MSSSPGHPQTPSLPLCGLHLGVFVCAELPLVATGPGMAPGLGTGAVPTESPPGFLLERPKVCLELVREGGGGSALIQGQRGVGQGEFGALQVPGMARLPRARVTLQNL